MHRALECQQRPSSTLSLQGLNLTLSSLRGVCLERKIPHTAEPWFQGQPGGLPGRQPLVGGRQGGGWVFGTVRSCLSRGTDVNSLGQRRQDLQPKQRIPEALLVRQHLHLISKPCVPLQAAISLQGGEAEPLPITLTHSAGAARPGTTSSQNGETETR